MTKIVAILMAVYRPNLQFLRQQLQSLNAQTYKNIRIYLCDDSQDEQVHTQIMQVVYETLVDVPFMVMTNIQNIGSNATFERLTQVVQADYFAYCDQDDVWDVQKIKKLVRAIQSKEAVLAYSYLRVIDAHNQIVSNRFDEYNKRIQMQSGSDLFSFFIRRNCVTGCSMLIDSQLAKEALPFSKDYVHDHWLSLVASTKGSIILVDEALVDYRLHDNNQIGKTVLGGVTAIDHYLPNKLVKERQKICTLQDRLALTPQQQQILQTELEHVNARIAWFEKPSVKTFLGLGAFVKSDAQLATFERIVRLLPKGVANRLIQKVKE